MAYQKNAYCSYCGHAFAVDQLWPRRCAHCNNLTFRNPLPVAVVIQPVDDGVLTVRRTIQPRSGWLALPGGYIEFGEAWQAAGARELWEEAGLQIDPATLREVRVFSAPDNTILIIALAPRLSSTQLAIFAATDEASERVIVSTPQELAFPLHTEVLSDYLAGKWRL
ncbi:MAG: NUDIX domain-containing protein [Caldilineaceae bacterium]|nr:NUDIX domain-containing protein [Caldilineaceae bacterium]